MECHACHGQRRMQNDHVHIRLRSLRLPLVNSCDSPKGLSHRSLTSIISNVNVMCGNTNLHDCHLIELPTGDIRSNCPRARGIASRPVLLRQYSLLGISSYFSPSIPQPSLALGSTLMSLIQY